MNSDEPQVSWQRKFFLYAFEYNRGFNLLNYSTVFLRIKKNFFLRSTSFKVFIKFVAIFLLLSHFAILALRPGGS